MSNAVGKRYAKALFELAKEKKSLDKVAKSLNEYGAPLEESPELRAALASPILSRDEQMNVVAAISKKAKLDPMVANTLGVMAKNGRIAYSQAMVDGFAEYMNSENEEVVAEVISAQDMTAAQVKKLAAVLKSKVGKDVTINTKVDPDILGGLVVNIGSTMIDNSLKGKLSKLHNAMKEVG